MYPKGNKKTSLLRNALWPERELNKNKVMLLLKSTTKLKYLYIMLLLSIRYGTKLSIALLLYCHQNLDCWNQMRDNPTIFTLDRIRWAQSLKQPGDPTRGHLVILTQSQIDTFTKPHYYYIYLNKVVILKEKKLIH